MKDQHILLNLLELKINSVMLNTQTDKISSSLQNRKKKNISTLVSKLFYVIINI